MPETLLTLFDSDNPRWTKELIALAGEDASLADTLTYRGSLDCADGIYSLTSSGAAEFERIKGELFLDITPGTVCSDPQRSVKRTKLRLLLDRAHLQRWGIKVYRTEEDLLFYPDLVDKELFSIKDGSLVWEYESSPLYIKICEDFKPSFIEGRRTDLVSSERITEWLKANSASPGKLEIDLLYLCHYDFMHYRDFAGHPNDDLKLINTDRFLFKFPGDDIKDDLEVIAKFHLWLNTLRRMLIPGYVDRDTQEQDSVSWLIFAADKEEEAKALAEKLSRFGEKLVENANPCEIWAVSAEALENVGEKRELIWELLPDIAHPVQRTLI